MLGAVGCRSRVTAGAVGPVGSWVVGRGEWRMLDSEPSCDPIKRRGFKVRHDPLPTTHYNPPVPDHDVPVLIVGGSLVGLSTALLLGHHGIRSFVVEHHRGTAIHPRAAQVHQRTMEIYREVGIEQIVRTRSDEQFVQDGAVMAVETLAGKELAYFIANLNEGIRDVSPSERVFISQTLLEPLLKTRAEELGATLRFATEMTSFSQDAD